MKEAGYSTWLRLGLDLGFVSFERRFRQLAEETEMVPLEKKSKRERAMVPRPKHDRETLLRVLGVDPGDAEAAAAASGLLPALSPADWDALEWGEDEAGDDGEG